MSCHIKHHFFFTWFLKIYCSFSIIQDSMSVHFLNIIACMVDYLPKIWTLHLWVPRTSIFLLLSIEKAFISSLYHLFLCTIYFFFPYFSCFGWLSLFFAHSFISIFILLASIFLWTIALQCNFFLGLFWVINMLLYKATFPTFFLFVLVF